MMKTITALLLSVLLLIAMAGCAKQHDETENISSQTLSQEETAEQKQQVPQQFAGKTIKESYLVRDVAFMPTFDNISSKADFVVRAKVEDVDYIIVNRTEDESQGKQPWTVIRVTVYESLKGDIPAGEQTIYAYGGYISEFDNLGEDSMRAHGEYASEEEFLRDKAEKQNSILHITFDGSKPPEAGKEYLFYLAGSIDGGVTPEGSYELFCGEYGQMEVQPDGTFVRKNCETEGEGTTTFTEDQVREKLQ